MKILLIALFIATSVALEAHIGLNHQVFELTHKWEMLQEASTKIRKAATDGVEKIKELVLSDNPEVGPLLAAAADHVLLDYYAFLDKLDAEIQAKTLTMAMFKEQFWAIHIDYHSTIGKVHDLSLHLSINAQNKFMQINTKTTNAVDNQVLTIEAILMGDGSTPL